MWRLRWVALKTWYWHWQVSRHARTRMRAMVAQAFYEGRLKELRVLPSGRIRAAR